MQSRTRRAQRAVFVMHAVKRKCMWSSNTCGKSRNKSFDGWEPPHSVSLRACTCLAIDALALLSSVGQGEQWRASSALLIGPAII